jgi:hypothetical protein
MGNGRQADARIGKIRKQLEKFYVAEAEEALATGFRDQTSGVLVMCKNPTRTFLRAVARSLKTDECRIKQGGSRWSFHKFEPRTIGSINEIGSFRLTKQSLRR